MLNLKSFAAAILAAGALSACSVEGIVDDINNAAIDSAFDIIKQSVEAQGGAAARVTPGKEVVLEVTNTASPIAGATVKVPANALPSDVEIAAVSIYHLPVIDGANEDVVVHGNGAIVAVTKLPGLEEVVLAAPLTISLPITSTSTKPIEQIVLGSSDISAGGIVAVDGSKGDAAKKHAVGDATNLKNAFAASWKVDYAGGAADENTLIYKVTNADNSVACMGQRSLETAGLNANYDFTGISFDFNLTVGVKGILTYKASEGASFANPATLPAAIPSADFASLTFTCDGATIYTAGSAPTVWTTQIASFTESSSQACGFPSSCTEHLGSAVITGEVEFTTATGEKVQAALNGKQESFSFDTNP